MELSDQESVQRETVEQKTKFFAPLFQVTPVSKYLALLLFILLPFIGGLVGYTYAPEKQTQIVEVAPRPNLPNIADKPSEYSYSKGDSIKVVSRMQTQRIGLNIKPFSKKYLNFYISTELAKNQQLDYIDHISFDADKGVILSDKNPLLGVTLMSTDSDIEKEIIKIRFKQFEGMGLSEGDIEKRINDYLIVRENISIKPSFEDVCNFYSWQSQGHTIYKLIPFDQETGTDLTSLCGYTRFLVIENLVIENYVPVPNDTYGISDDITLVE